MLDLKPKCYIDDYEIEINSELSYEEGAELIRKIYECIEVDEEIPMGTVSILFTNWTYSIPISKKDNLRIRKILKDLGYDRQYVENIYNYDNY